MNLLKKIENMGFKWRPQKSQLITMRGEYRITIYNPDGTIKSDDVIENLITTVGKQHAADQMSDQGNAAMGWMAVGTGTTAPAVTDTALETEIARKALTSTDQGTGDDANKVIHVCDWAAGEGTGALTEAGLFNMASAGVMFSRVVFPVKNKEAGEAMTQTYTLTMV